MNTRHFKHGFTLVELLVVVSIIAVLMALLLPALNKARALAKQTVCMSNHRQIMLALVTYVDSHDGYGPSNSYMNPNLGSNGAYVRWLHRDSLGQYLGNTAAYDGKPNTTNAVYCTTSERISSTSYVGIGITVRRYARVARDEASTEPQAKFIGVRSPGQFITFVDIRSGWRWEKFHMSESSPYNSTGNGIGAMVAYRHCDSNAAASFGDGHVEIFTVSDPETDGYNVGLHAATLNQSVTWKYTGP